MQLSAAALLGPAQNSGGSRSGGGGGVDRFYIGSGARAPRKCPSGYSSSSAGVGQNKSWYCVRTSGGGGRTVPAPAAPTITVSPTTQITPTFQQSFTPQFAPVLQQMQDSPGAAQAGAPQMTAPSPQTAAPTATTGPSQEEIRLREELARMKALQEARAEYERKLAEQVEREPETVTLPQPVPQPQTMPAYTPPPSSPAIAPTFVPPEYEPVPTYDTIPGATPPPESEGFNYMWLLAGAAVIGGAILLNKPKRKGKRK